MATHECPSCKGGVSPKAFDCPHCGHPIRKPKRGFFGFLFKWALILFNLLMLIWLVGYFAQLGEMLNSTSDEFEQAGAAIGGTIGVGFLMIILLFGNVILGIPTLLTRPSK